MVAEAGMHKGSMIDSPTENVTLFSTFRDATGATIIMAVASMMSGRAD